MRRQRARALQPHPQTHESILRDCGHSPERRRWRAVIYPLSIACKRRVGQDEKSSYIIGIVQKPNDVAAVRYVWLESDTKLSCSTKMSEPETEPFSINELGGPITVVAGAAAAALFALLKSSCADISCCGLRCKRDPVLPASS